MLAVPVLAFIFADVRLAAKYKPVPNRTALVGRALSNDESRDCSPLLKRVQTGNMRMQPLF